MRCKGQSLCFEASARFQYCCEGTVLLVLIPVAGIVASKSSLQGLHSMLSNLTPNAAAQWMDKNSVRMKLDAGEICWVPYGWVVWTVTTGTGNSYVYDIPVFSEGLLLTSPPAVRKEISEFQVKFIDQVGSVAPWDEIGDCIRRWSERLLNQ